MGMKLDEVDLFIERLEKTINKFQKLNAPAPVIDNPVQEKGETNLETNQSVIKEIETSGSLNVDTEGKNEN